MKNVMLAFVCLAVCASGICGSVSSASAQQSSLVGSWCGTLGGDWKYDAPSRDLVVEEDGTCRWDVPKATPGKAKTCVVKADGLELTTGAGSKVGLKSSGDHLEGWFTLKGAGAVYTVTATRGACKR